MKIRTLHNPAFRGGCIIVIMQGTKGYCISPISGYTTSWVDDNGEGEIDHIIPAWLLYQTDIEYLHEDVRYLGYRWWAATQHTIEERKGIAEASEFH